MRHNGLYNNISSWIRNTEKLIYQEPSLSSPVMSVFYTQMNQVLDLLLRNIAVLRICHLKVKHSETNLSKTSILF